MTTWGVLSRPATRKGQTSRTTSAVQEAGVPAQVAEKVDIGVSAALTMGTSVALSAGTSITSSSTKIATPATTKTLSTTVNKIVPTVTEQAVAISKQVEKNSISIRTPNKTLHFDLQGAAHKGIPTPHIQHSLPNVNPRTGQTFWNKDRQWVQPMK